MIRPLNKKDFEKFVIDALVPGKEYQMNDICQAVYDDQWPYWTYNFPRMDIVQAVWRLLNNGKINSPINPPLRFILLDETNVER